MDKNTVYILQKDLPNAKAGDKYESTDSGENYINLNAMATWDVSYPKEYIENNSDWFVKEEVNESKPTEQFQWTDELVKEFTLGAIKLQNSLPNEVSLDRGIYHFKKEKSKKEEPQWEILSFKNLRSGIVYVKKDNGKFNSGNGLDWDLEKFDIKDHEIINSVKRFPDNTVWIVDDDTQHGKISGFKIAGSTMIAEIKNTVFPYDYPLYLSELKAPKEEQVQPHKCKYCGIMVTSDSDEGCYANPNKPVDNIGSAGKTFTAPESLSQHPMCKTEEQVPIKVEYLWEIPGIDKKTAPQVKYELKMTGRIPHEKYKSLTTAIEEIINHDKVLIAPYIPNQGYRIDMSSLENVDLCHSNYHTSEELLQARRDAFSSGYTRGWHNGCFEEDKTLSKKITDKKFEDYINSLK